MMLNLDKARLVAEDFKKYKTDPMALYKQAQNDHSSVSDILETLDPTPRDENGEKQVSIDALGRHLMALGLEIHGQHSATLEQLAIAAEYLMPELIRREVEAGMRAAERYAYGDCIAATVDHKGLSYHPIYIPDLNISSAATRRGKSLGRVSAGQGGEFPKLSIFAREKDIAIGAAGRQVECHYNVIRNYPWEDLGIMFRLIGAQMAVDKMFDLYDVGVHGDGSVGAAADTFNGTAGTLIYTDLVHNFLSYNAPFHMDRILAPQTAMETILTMAQFQDPLSGWKFQKDGQIVTPIGAKMKQVDATNGGTPTQTVIVTLDSRFAVREVKSRPLSIEAEKIIARQFENAVISEEYAFSVIADGAIKRIVYT